MLLFLILFLLLILLFIIVSFITKINSLIHCASNQDFSVKEKTIRLLGLLLLPVFSPFYLIKNSNNRFIRISSYYEITCLALILVGYIWYYNTSKERLGSVFAKLDNKIYNTDLTQLNSQQKKDLFNKIKKLKEKGEKLSLTEFDKINGIVSLTDKIVESSKDNKLSKADYIKWSAQNEIVEEIGEEKFKVEKKKVSKKANQEIEITRQREPLAQLNEISRMLDEMD